MQYPNVLTPVQPKVGDQGTSKEELLSEPEASTVDFFMTAQHCLPSCSKELTEDLPVQPLPGEQHVNLQFASPDTQVSLAENNMFDLTDQLNLEQFELDVEDNSPSQKISFF